VSEAASPEESAPSSGIRTTSVCGLAGAIVGSQKIEPFGEIGLCARQPTQFGERGGPSLAQACDFLPDFAGERFVAKAAEPRALAGNVLPDLLDQGHPFGERGQERVRDLANPALRLEAADDRARIERIGVGALDQDFA
jgi:hypothetical protein